VALILLGETRVNIVRDAVLAILLGLIAPRALEAQVTLAPKIPAGFSMTIQGQRQGVFPGNKGGTIGGLRFSYLLKSPRDPASGLPTGKRMHTPVVFTKTLGTASPQIFSALSTNENLPSVVISVPGGDGGLGYRVKLTNANLAELRQYTELVNGVATVLEDVSFTFQKIEVQDLGSGAMATDDWNVLAE
jgi:type VI secretion system secreted protein Hcp